MPNNSPVDRGLLALVLAAGQGKRMRSDQAKVLHEVRSRPMIFHVLDSLAPLKAANTVVVIGHRGEAVRAAVGTRYSVSFVVQTEQLGTAHAVLAARDILDDFTGRVLILCGDTPLIRSQTLADLISSHDRAAGLMTVMTCSLEDPGHYGRVILRDAGRVERIVEYRDAGEAERRVQVVNTGIYCVESSFLLEGLSRIGRENQQEEFYLTDLVEIANGAGGLVNRFSCPDPEEIAGVNTREELVEINRW